MATLRRPFCTVAPLFGAMSSMSTLRSWGATILTMLCRVTDSSFERTQAMNPHGKDHHHVKCQCCNVHICVAELLPFSYCSAESQTAYLREGTSHFTLMAKTTMLLFYANAAMVAAVLPSSQCSAESHHLIKDHPCSFITRACDKGMPGRPQKPS